MTWILLAQTAHADCQPSIAMVGEPHYKTGFTHYDYADPDAPKGGTLKLAATGTYDSLNPFIVRGNPALGLNTGYLSLIYEPLMARSADEPFSLYPLLASCIDVSADRSWATFMLNDKAHFSDGTPVTADDVMFSFETLRDKGRPNHRTYYKKVLKAEKLDNSTVRFTFKPNDKGVVDREMPLIMGLMPILPQHDWDKREFNKTSLHIPIGSGPYTITKLEPGRAITYTRNQDYWGRDLPVEKGLHNFDKIQIDYYRDDNVALQAFKAGQFDYRHENDPNRWATNYDFPAAHDGRVSLEESAHHRTEPAAGFIFNTRREPFNDPVLREALSYAFDSAWIDRNMFHDRYHRVTSYFPNSELAAPELPDEREKAILETYRSQLPADIFTTPVTPPATDGTEESLRNNLLKASSLLREAGYKMRDDQLLTPSGKPVAFDILLADPSEEKIALNWIRALKRLGITARTRTVDSAQYQARLASFDYDVISGKWINSLSPGNEQIFFYGSAAANQQGSRNYAGIKNPVIDALASSIPEAATREILVATVHALDRVLMSGHYMVPLYYLGADDMAYWNKLKHPSATPPYGVVIETWWAK